MADDNSNKNKSSGGGGRSLGGAAAEPLPAGWGSSSAAPRVGRVGQWGGSSGPAPSRSGPRIAGLRDLQAQSGGLPARGPPAAGRGQSHDDDDDGEDDEGGDDGDDQGEEWFAGGERSGINVENPDRPAGSSNIVKDILKKASQAEPRADASAGRSSAFGGSGNTLGSDELPSTLVPDPSAVDADPNEQETAIRNLTFWKEGFSVEDGPLLRYDDEGNKRILAAINNGDAPPSVLNVQINQPVELRVARRTNESYQAPPKRLETFSGTGNRLGAPVPEVISNTARSVPGSFPGAPTTGGSEDRASSAQPRFEVDQSLPTTSIQVRLADGTRIVARMNHTHTVGDIRNFINASRPASEARPYTIGTTFPNRTLDDDSVTIEKGGLLNSVVVQRWS